MLKLSREKRLKIPLYVLILLSVYTSVQAIWWVSFQFQEGQHYRELNMQLLEERVLLAEQELNDKDSLSLTDRLSFEHRYDGLTLALSDRFPSGWAPVISRDRQSQIWLESAYRVRMFTTEGIVFVVVLLFGVLYQARAYRRQLRYREQQSNFVSAVSHELKSPLTSIRLFGELARRDNLPAEKRAEISQQILSNVDRLTGLVDEILRSRKLEEEKMELQLRAMSISDWLTEWSHAAQILAREKGFVLEISIGSENLNVRMDPKAMESVVGNLFSNAMKYSPKGSQICIQLEKRAHFAELSVTDNGVGFDEVERPMLFERFYRAGNEMTRRTKGTGLGLFIVRELMQNMNGKVVAESAGPGKGSRFSIYLSSQKPDS